MAARRAKPDQAARRGRYDRIEAALSSEIGGRLRQAREDRGLSQQALGQQLGYAAAMISAFETGRRRMKVEDLARACIALAKDPDFFLNTGTLVEELRSSEPIGATLRAEVANLPHEALTTSIQAFLDALEEEVLPEPLPDLSHLKAEAAASHVLDLAGILGPPVQMEHVCSALGVPIYKRNFPDALSALVVQVGPSGHVAIGVNSHHAATRRRFSIAHELGHAVLRHEASYYLEYSVDDGGEPPGYRYLDEREANAFAAALLMDERWVRQDFAEGMRSTLQLADRYEVSEAAMGWRLTNLSLV